MEFALQLKSDLMTYLKQFIVIANIFFRGQTNQEQITPMVKFVNSFLFGRVKPHKDIK